MVKKNAWVQIEKVLLQPQQRTGKLPEETKKVPFRMWVKGRLQQDAEIGEVVTILTKTGRTEEGVLVEENPQYQVGYGDYVDELSHVGDNARQILFGGGEK